MARKHRPLWNATSHELVMLISIIALLGIIFTGVSMTDSPASGLVALQSSFEPFDYGVEPFPSDFDGVLNCYADHDNDDPFHIGKVTAFVVMDNDEPYVLFEGYDICVVDSEGDMALREYRCDRGKVAYTDGYCTAGYTADERGCRCN